MPAALPRRATLLAVLACAGCGGGALHRLPETGDGDLAAARDEIRADRAPPRRAVTEGEALATLRRVEARLLPAAGEICREVGAGTCEWRVRTARDRSLNAGSGAGGLIVLNRGVFDHAANDDEVAFVLAHEIGHQAADHLPSARRTRVAGQVANVVLLAILGAGTMGLLGWEGTGTSRATRRLTGAGSETGGTIGRVAYSREQEREADYLATLILHRAGYDLDRARGALLTLARAAERRRETGMLDTHPTGPERLAAFDRAVAEIRAGGGRLPPRAEGGPLGLW